MEVSASFLEERAVSLATVLLTRDFRVLVTQSLRFEGFDLQVKITHGNRFSGHFLLHSPPRLARSSMGFENGWGETASDWCRANQGTHKLGSRYK